MLRFMVVLTVLLFGLSAGLYVHDRNAIQQAAKPAVLTLSDQHEQAVAAERKQILALVQAAFPAAILGDTKHEGFTTAFDGITNGDTFTGYFDSHDGTIHVTLDRDTKNRVTP